MRTGELARRFVDLSYFRTFELTPNHREPEPTEVPGPFKAYPGRPLLPLHRPVPLALRAAASGRLDERSLSALLYYGYGVSRMDSGPGVHWRYHRFVASARCLFPAEVYLVSDGGAYYYDTLHHALRPLTAPLAPDGVPLIVLSTLFAKTAHRYEDFAYRLVNQEAGLTAGNLLLVAQALGLDARLLLQFRDRTVNGRLDLRAGEESAVALIAFGDRCPPDDVVTAQQNGHTGVRYPLDRQRCARLLSLDEAARKTGDAPAVEDRPSPRPCSGGEPVPVPPRADPAPDLTDALRARNSGDAWFRPEPDPVPAAAFGAALRGALRPVPGDVPLDAFAIRVYAVANRVDGLAPGGYEWCIPCAALHRVRAGDLSRRLQALYIQPAVNCAAANFVVYVVANFAWACARFGDRAYRMGHLLGGVVAQRVSVAGAAAGLTVRCSDAYDAVRVRELLDLGEDNDVPIFQLVVGRERPGAGGGQRYRHELVF